MRTTSVVCWRSCGACRRCRSLLLPASCSERAVDVEVECVVSTRTTLRFYDLRQRDEDGEPVEEVGVWVLD